MINEHYVEPIIIDNRDMEPPVPQPDGSIYENRRAAYSMYDAPDVPKCSIIVIGYNRLHKTKYCIECVLKYVEDISYELILVDNGSDDGTYEFFQSVPYENKVILKIEKNIGASYGIIRAYDVCKGKFLVLLPNDVYLTKNALSNLINCFESDPAIGSVVPVSSNCTNAQQVDLDFSTMEEMQEKAAEYNMPDPSKWEERMRLISVIWIMTREIRDIVGIGDPVYMHDFSEDDMAIRIRRAGYKLILCKDTWVHHDHDIRNNPEKDPQKHNLSLHSGRAVYSQKYYGLDAWNDIVNLELSLLSSLDTAEINEAPRVLCADVLSGTPVLDVRNKLRVRGVTDGTYHAFTTQAKYFLDLQTIGCETVHDRIDYIGEHYADGSFDIVLCGKPVNLYDAPMTVINKFYALLKPGGILFFKTRNTDDFYSLLRSSGLSDETDAGMPVCLPVDIVFARLTELGGKEISITGSIHPLKGDEQEDVRRILRKVKPDADEGDFTHIITKDYEIRVVKG